MSTLIIAEIGLNHQGDINIAKALVDVAARAGADVVKFQKRTPRLCLSTRLWNEIRDTPFGRMTYLDYRERIEFWEFEYAQIDAHCKRSGIRWSASPWDIRSVEFLQKFDLPFIKIASATLTNSVVVAAVARTKKHVIMSTGMSTLTQIRTAMHILSRGGAKRITLLACTSTYPCPIDELNLNRIQTLKILFPSCEIGYSGHEAGLWTTLCAVAMGAQVVERHITLDRTMTGSDHAASVEPQGLARLVREIRNFEKARGTGEIGPVASELPMMKRLRE